MERAEECAHVIKAKDADCAVAAVVWPLYWLNRQSHNDTELRLLRAEERLLEFAESCDYAWKIDGFERAPPTYLFFNIVHDWR